MLTDWGAVFVLVFLAAGVLAMSLGAWDSQRYAASFALLAVTVVLGGTAVVGAYSL